MYTYISTSYSKVSGVSMAHAASLARQQLYYVVYWETIGRRRPISIITKISLPPPAPQKKYCDVRFFETFSYYSSFDNVSHMPGYDTLDKVSWWQNIQPE